MESQETIKKQDIRLKIKDDFNEFPGLRLHNESKGVSGEDFYHEVLNNKFHEAYTSNIDLIVDLDDTAGYPPSFLDEAFGRLIFDFGLELVNKKVQIISKDESIWINMIKESTFKMWDERRQKKQVPVCSEDYPNKPWWHLFSNSELKLISSYDECR